MRGWRSRLVALSSTTHDTRHHQAGTACSSLRHLRTPLRVLIHLKMGYCGFVKHTRIIGKIYLRGTISRNVYLYILCIHQLNAIYERQTKRVLVYSTSFGGWSAWVRSGTTTIYVTTKTKLFRLCTARERPMVVLNFEEQPCPHTAAWFALNSVFPTFQLLVYLGLGQSRKAISSDSAQPGRLTIPLDFTSHLK